MLKTPIIITGCQRSGTTLMRLVLDSHPNIFSIDEDQFHYPSLPTYLNAKWPQSFICFKLPEYASVLQLLRSTSNLKIIWCIRDPIDSVSSMMKLHKNLDNKNTVPWAAHPMCAQLEIINCYWPLDAAKKLELAEYMAKYQVIANINPLDRTRHENIFLGSLCWAIKNSLPELYKEKGIGFHTVFYEEFVTSPKQMIKSVLDYIGADWNNDVLRHHEKHEGKSIGNTSNTRPIDNRGVGQGIQNFTREEVEFIQTVCGVVADTPYILR